MSTKAYEGVRFRARTLTALVADLTLAFAEFDRLAADHEAQFVAREAARTYDADWMAWKTDTTGNIGEPGEFSAYVSRAWREMKKRQQDIRATRRRDPDVDSQVEIQVWLGPGRTLYGYVHTEVSGVRQHLLASQLAEDFAYWNNSDRDEGVSAAQWRHRARVWNRLLDGQCGKSFQFLSAEHSWPDKDLVTSKLPDPRSRARLLSEDAMYPLWLQANGMSEVPDHRIGSTVMRFLRECKQDDGPWKARFDARATELETLLPPLSIA